ncbi:MAG: hypothetical protein EOP34_07730, partial [Rickettsiales bacterium]
MPSINYQVKLESNRIEFRKTIEQLISDLKEQKIFSREKLFEEIIDQIKLQRIRLDLDAYQPTNIMSNG